MGSFSRIHWMDGGIGSDPPLHITALPAEIPVQYTSALDCTMLQSARSSTVFRMHHRVLLVARDLLVLVVPVNSCVPSLLLDTGNDNVFSVTALNHRAIKAYPRAHMHRDSDLRS